MINFVKINYNFNMRMNWGMWIGVIGGLIGGGVGIASAIIFGGLPGTIMAVVFVGIFAAVFYPLLIKPMMTAAKLRKNGIAAQAKILEVNDTGVTLNNSPQVKLMLEVTSPTGTYLVETKQYISRLQTSLFQPGAVIPVLIDPNDRNLISLDYEGKGGGTSQNTGGNQDTVTIGPWAGMSRQAAEQKLVDIDAKNKVILGYGTSCRAIVTKYTWLGIYVNGNNPASEIEVQVLPADRPSFQAKCIGVIGESAVPKYQPGEDIYVKYDPNDTAKITIEHS